MSDILTDVSAAVLTITLSRLERKNAFTQAMYSRVAELLDQAAHDDTVRVVVLQGHETVFSAGNDIHDFLEQPPATDDAPVFRLLRALVTFAKPLVAAVCGPAVGIGTTLLLHCDLVYAGDNAVFAMPFVNLGLCPEAGASLLVPRLFGHQRAAEVLLLGEPFMVEQALELGLVNRIVPPSEVTALARTQAIKLAARPQAAVISSKRLMRQSERAHLLAQIDAEAQEFRALLQAPAAREAFGAFLEKRRPDFSAL